MAQTGNGWEVILSASDPRLKTWTVPGANRRLTARRDAGGFVLIYLVTWFNDVVERLDALGHDLVDEGAWNPRRIAGSKFYSEHAAGRAADLNWSKHPSGVPIARTFTAAQIKSIRYIVKWINRLAFGTVVEWGGEWPTHPGSSAKTDGMHFQIHKGSLGRVARTLSKGPRGRRILKANPWVTAADLKRAAA